MKNKELQAVVRKIEKHRAAIAAERNELRKLHEEIESLLDPVDRGLEDLDHAIDALSEQA